MEESYSKYAPKYGTSTDIKSEKPPTKKERSIPLWIKVLLFVVVSVFLFLVYQSMETNQGNPFSKYLNIGSPGGAKWVSFWKAHPIDLLFLIVEISSALSSAQGLLTNNVIGSW